MITSAPGLASAFRETDQRGFIQPTSLGNRPHDLVRMYHIDRGDLETEAQSAARLVSEISERLRRLSIAYAEWSIFDAPAFFDLSTRQAARLIRISERVHTVYVVFFTDLLLPTFHAAESYWAERFVPAYHAASPAHSMVATAKDLTLDPFDSAFHEEVMPELVAHWSRLLAVIRQTREILASDIGFLTTNGSQDERARWRRVWQKMPAPGLDSALTPALADIPSLTLSIEFPLPAHRQSGRQRRLRRNREHQRLRRAHGY